MAPMSDDEEQPCVCGRQRIKSIQDIADHFGFTYQQAFDYVLTIGIAHSQSALTQKEPGE